MILDVVSSSAIRILLGALGGSSSEATRDASWGPEQPPDHRRDRCNSSATKARSGAPNRPDATATQCSRIRDDGADLFLDGVRASPGPPGIVTSCRAA